MLKKFVKNLSANIYLNAAEEMGLDFDVLSADYSLARIYGNAGALTVCKAFIGHDNAMMVGAIQNKTWAHRLLESANIPVPVQKTFAVRPGRHAETDSTPVFEFASSRYPVVVKPAIGKLGRGVFVGIENDEQLAYALSRVLASESYPARGGSKHFMLETQLIGREYRILVCAGVVVDILEKTTGSVRGNGVDAVQALIEAENATRSGFEVIQDYDRIRAHLAQSGLTLGSVPIDGVRVTLDNTCFLPTGGIMQRIDPSSVSLDQLELFQRVADLSGLNLAGIDYISGELSQPPDGSSGVLEVNTGTSSAIHYLARPGPDLAPVRRIIELTMESVDFPGWL